MAEASRGRVGEGPVGGSHPRPPAQGGERQGKVGGRSSPEDSGGTFTL